MYFIYRKDMFIYNWEKATHLQFYNPGCSDLALNSSEILYSQPPPAYD